MKAIGGPPPAFVYRGFTCVCECVCVCVNKYICRNACIYTHLSVCVHAYLCVCVDARSSEGSLLDTAFQGKSIIIIHYLCVYNPVYLCVFKRLMCTLQDVYIYISSENYYQTPAPH